MVVMHMRESEYARFQDLLAAIKQESSSLFIKGQKQGTSVETAKKVYTSLERMEELLKECSISRLLPISESEVMRDERSQQRTSSEQIQNR